MWWRVLVPTWRFFDADFHPQLLIRDGESWRIAWERPWPRWYALIFNPRMTQYLAYRNLLERLVLELNTDGNQSETVSFSLVRHLVQEREFKIVLGGEEIVHFSPAQA